MINKKGNEFSSTQKGNIAANYRKLWLKLKVDAPFMLQVTKIQKDWDLPLAYESNNVWKNYTQYLAPHNSICHRSRRGRRRRLAARRRGGVSG